MKIIRQAKIYLAQKRRETALKEKQDKVNLIVKYLTENNTTKESIELLTQATEKFNNILDIKLINSISEVSNISEYKRLKRGAKEIKTEKIL